MCRQCNGGCNGLGATAPLQKVATTTAPLHTPPIAPQITTGGTAQRVYSPPVTKSGGLWEGLTNLATGVFDFVNTNNQNKAMQQAYQNQYAYGVQQQPQVQYIQQPAPQQAGFNAGSVAKAALLAGIIVGGIYLIKK